jgi:P-type Cu+ transporter
MKALSGNHPILNVFYSDHESGGHQHQHQHHHGHQGDKGNDHAAGAKYFCPMKCEGEKVYNEPGNCPVCHMKLVPVKK